MVVWQASSATTGWDIHGQLFNASGTKVGCEFVANVYTTNDQTDPSVSMDAAGDFVISWSSFGQDGNGWGVFARQYNASGLPITAKEFQVNQTALYNQVESDVACDPNGNYTVVWASNQQDDPITKDYGVYARMFLGNGSDYLTSSGTASGESASTRRHSATK